LFHVLPPCLLLPRCVIGLDQMNIRVLVTLFGQFVDGIKRMDACLCFSLLWFVAHAVLFRVMDQRDAAEVSNLQQLRVALTLDNVNDVVYGWTTLHLAAGNGHADCVSYCIKMGANVNAPMLDILHCTLHHGTDTSMLFVCCWTRVRLLTPQMMRDVHHYIVLFATNICYTTTG
jgi:hypothetical protein